MPANISMWASLSNPQETPPPPSGQSCKQTWLFEPEPAHRTSRHFRLEDKGGLSPPPVIGCGEVIHHIIVTPHHQVRSLFLGCSCLVSQADPTTRKPTFLGSPHFAETFTIGRTNQARRPISVDTNTSSTDKTPCIPSSLGIARHASQSGGEAPCRRREAPSLPVGLRESLRIPAACHPKTGSEKHRPEAPMFGSHQLKGWRLRTP